MADPFAYTPQAPQNTQGQGFLGIPQTMWQNLANFGANTAVAANARTPGGFLEYGTGLAGPMGEGMLQTEAQNKALAEQQAQMGLQSAQTQGLQISNIMNQLQIPKAEFYAKMYGDPNAMNAFLNGGEIPGSNQPGATSQPPTSSSGAAPTASGNPGWATAAGTTQNAPGSEGTGPLGNAISTIESKNDPTAMNAGGYLGAFQFGSAALQSAGMYTPGKGEDVTKNSWGGTINVPGFEPMSAAQFAHNPPAQAAAWNVQQSYLWQQAQNTHMDMAIGQNVGGTQLSQAGLIAGMHFAGVGGMQQYIMSGGKYNPNDNPSNPSQGTYLSDYIAKAQNLTQLQQNYDPSRMANPSDTPGPFIPAGGVTPGKAQGLANDLSAKIQRYKMLGLPTTGMEAQLGMYTKIAEAPYANVDIRSNGAALVGGNVVKMGTPTQVYGAGNAAIPAAEFSGLSVNGNPIEPTTIEPAQVKGMGGNGSGVAQPTQGPSFFDAAVAGQPLPPAPANGGGLAYAKPLPFTEETVQAGVKKLDDLQDQADEAAQSAEGTLAQVNSMKFETANINTDNFAPYLQDIRKATLTAAHMFGLSDQQMPELAQTAGNTAAAQKNTMTLVMNVARQTSSRMAVQEVNMIQTATPNISMPKNGYRIITDQISGLAQYQVARSQAFSKWHSALTQTDPGTQIQQMNTSFDAQFNQRITPMAFIAHQWMQSPEGQQYLGEYLQYLKGLGAPGVAEIGRLRSQLQYGDNTGLFSTSAGGGGQ